MATKTHQRRNGQGRRPDPRAAALATARRSRIAPPAEPARDSLAREIDSRIDERFDGETTRSSLAILLSGFAVLMAAVAGIAIFLVAGDDTRHEAALPAGTRGAAAAGATMPAATSGTAAGKDIAFEPYERPDPTLPATPSGAVKKFRVDVFEHVTKVSAELPPTRVWSFGVNGNLYRGTGVSAPIVVTQGDRVKIELVNGASKAMNVKMAHSIDLHAAEVAPNEAFVTVPPGGKQDLSFLAKHPGVFMYHCATDPVLMHTGAGMVGMILVKPRNLPRVDRELWITQQEYYLGQPGQDPDMAKMEAERPDAIAFNGYASQYKDHPIAVKRGERIRMFVLNAGPSKWSAFHVIGTVFDRTVVEGVVGHDSQTMSLAPSQGGWAEFTLDHEGTYPFVTHAFGDMVKGAVGVLATENAPAPTAGSSH
jgi:nitrite reductase (NO-forming)